MFKCHMAALLLGTVLGFFVKSSSCKVNLTNTIKSYVTFLDQAILGTDFVYIEKSDRRSYGNLLLALVLIPVVFVTAFLMLSFYTLNTFLGVCFEAFLTWQCLGLRDLICVGQELIFNSYDDAEELSSDVLEERTKNEISLLAKNSADMVIGPLIFLFLGGPVFGVFYKAVDITDELVGRRTERYSDFGYSAARFNDFVNFIPSRFTGWLAVMSSRSIYEDFNYKNAKYIFMRDRKDVNSLNSAQVRAAFAGALSLKLGTEIGDADKEIELTDVRKANKLLLHMFVSCQVFLLIIFILFH